MKPARSPARPSPVDAEPCSLPTRLPNGFVEGYDVVTNVPKSAAYRAPGSPAASFAAEQAIDELCEKLGVDPVEFRLNNACKEGSRQIGGPAFRRIGMVEVLQATQEHAHLAAPVPEPSAPGRVTGRGIAAGAWFNGTGPATAVASVMPDGTVSLIEGSPRHRRFSRRHGHARCRSSRTARGTHPSRPSWTPTASATAAAPAAAVSPSRWVLPFTRPARTCAAR